MNKTQNHKTAGGIKVKSIEFHRAVFWFKQNLALKFGFS